MSQEVLVNYYAQRAPTFDQIYEKKERQGDLQQVAAQVSSALRNHDVIEFACGTGYWTEIYAQVAKSVYATDINQSMLACARQKNYPSENVQFGSLDIYSNNASLDKKFTASFAGFLWSHIPREEYAQILQSIRSYTGSGTILVLIDNNYVEKGSSPIARTDREGNTFQLRDQEDGSRVEILKNFPTDSFLRKRFSAYARDIRVIRNEFFWMLTCVLK